MFVCLSTTTNEEVVPFVCSTCWSHILVVIFIYLQTEVIDGLPLGLLKAELNSKEITLYHASHLAHLSLIENSIIDDLDLTMMAHELRISDGRFYRPINLSKRKHIPLIHRQIDMNLVWGYLGSFCSSAMPVKTLNSKIIHLSYYS